MLECLLFVLLKELTKQTYSCYRVAMLLKLVLHKVLISTKRQENVNLCFRININVSKVNESKVFRHIGIQKTILTNCANFERNLEKA